MTRLPICALSLTLAASAFSQTLDFPGPDGDLRIWTVAKDVLRIDFRPGGVGDRPTEIMDQSGLRAAKPVGSASANILDTSRMHVSVTANGITISPPTGPPVLYVDRGALAKGTFRLRDPIDENLYGMRGSDLGGGPLARSMFRNAGALVRGSAQGDGGAPLAYTTRWGMFVDSVDGEFKNVDRVLSFSNGSRKEIEAYVVLGPPKRSIEVATLLTGRPPMPPRWSLGFMNSQWGTTEDEVKSIVAEYRKKQIPLDAFILDFDFKAWGEDNFGEWRWNSTSGPGNFEPDKFPDGASGLFGKQMLDKGVHVVGIMKPRILTQTVDLKPTMAAAEASARGWFMPGKKPYRDYFSHRLANDLDFSNPDLRKWYWQHSKGLFDTGISGWWNDEADDGFDSLGFFHMQQALFEGQRSVSPLRVWSLNRNFYLGAQRYAFGTWSGDINTGFDSMQQQRLRMLTMIDLGQSEWSMDAGGFGGHPSPENYARWLEFAAVVPIMRVHNTYGEHRQPWVYGPTAEAAATKAIRLRYSLLPYLQSAQHNATETGVGIVRPLYWEFPGDLRCAGMTESWMVGDALLASPIVEEGQQVKKVYLPEGDWFDYWTDKPYLGHRIVSIDTDSKNWSDIPLFVRGGSIVATQPVMPFTGAAPVHEITLDIWPDPKRRASFEVYDDDGATMAYANGAFFSQRVTARLAGKRTIVRFERPTGTYPSPLQTYRVRIHGGGSSVQVDGSNISSSAVSGVLEFRVPAGQSQTLEVR